MLDSLASKTSEDQIRDADPDETDDWLAALDSLVRASGAERAKFILSALDRKAKDLGVGVDPALGKECPNDAGTDLARPSHALKELPIDLSVQSPVAIVTLRNRTLSPVVQLFIQCAREVAQALPGRQRPRKI